MFFIFLYEYNYGIKNQKITSNLFLFASVLSLFSFRTSETMSKASDTLILLVWPKYYSKKQFAYIHKLIDKLKLSTKARGLYNWDLVFSIVEFNIIVQ